MKFALLAGVKNFLFPAPAHARHGLTHVCVCVALFCAWSMPQPDAVKSVAARVSESELDASLQRAATLALGAREGTIIVLDAQTGRVRAAVNPRLAEAAAFPPGSAIKPFTLLAALRARVINSDARLSCRKHFKRHGADFTCSHPVYNPPFNSAQALAHSCNYYFARLAERLPQDEFNTTLAAYRLGVHDAPNAAAAAAAAAATTLKASVVAGDRTTATATAAAAGTAASPRLPRGAWQVSTALGEGQELLVSPVQLVAAYAALFNGGRLYRAQTDAPENFRPPQIAQLDIAPAERTLLLAGLRGAVKYGTASASELASLPTHVFGKTGTATEADTLHTHGWFVGFAVERASPGSDEADAHARTQTEQPAPAEVKLAVLVFLKRGQGKQSAELARPIFAEHAHLTTHGNKTSAAPHDSSATASTSTEDFAGDSSSTAPPASSGASPVVRVRLARAEATRALSLDDYLFGVLAAEASVEDEFAALKAQAVVSRTYALANLRRHARSGYDFCDTTHCQRFVEITEENARPDFHELVRRAVHETSGEALRDGRGSLAAGVFFSTSCGGQTANLGTLWGTPAREPYQRGVRDEYCAAMPHTRWTDAIPATQLARALREDARTDVGARVDALTIVKRDATGRAEEIAIAGERRRVVVRGWDFKIIVGRTLGWSVLKSSRFEVRRAGDKFVFRGSGFGHGLGLCQSGAHVMAARGSSYRQILAHYFPATTVGGASTAETTHTMQPQQQTQARRTWLESHENAAIQNAAPPQQQHATPRSAAQRQDRRHRDRRHRDRRRQTATRARAGDASPASFEHAGFAHANFNVAGVSASPSSLMLPSSPLSPEPARLTLSSENFRVSYPARGAQAARREVESALAVLEAVRADVRARLAAASLAFPALGVLEVTVHETTGDFTGATGKPAWVAATTDEPRGSGVRRIELQPLATLRRRGVLTPTLRHEYAHAVISALSRSRAPRWLSEGLAAHVANEGARLTRVEAQEKLSREYLEERLGRTAASAAEMRALYAAAFREVNALIRAEGEPNVWRRVARS